MRSSPITEWEHVLKELKKLLYESKSNKKPKRLLNIGEAAHYLGISPKTLRNMLCPNRVLKN